MSAAGQAVRDGGFAALAIELTERRAQREERSARLWRMTAAERVAAMWRGELSLRDCCEWSSRAPHEVPLLGGEFAYIAMWTPEWAEARDRALERS
jgi:hypothetical protein